MMSRWVIAGPFAAVALALAGSLAALALDFDYTSLWPVEILTGLVLGFFSARETGRIRAGVLAGLAYEFTTATLGWAIVWSIVPDAPAPGDQRVAWIVVIVVVVTAFGALEGAIGGWLAMRRGRG